MATNAVTLRPSAYPSACHCEHLVEEETLAAFIAWSDGRLLARHRLVDVELYGAVR